MAEDIERTIYKLELDGTAYIEGADKLSASTNKLTQTQDAANKKLAELNAQQSAYKKSLDEVSAVLRANEAETLQLTKDLNLLKEAQKGNSDQAKNLQSQLRNNAASTKEFRIEQAALKTSLTDTNTQIKFHSTELKKAEDAHIGFAKGATKAYSALRSLANIIPGIGVGGLVLLVAGPLVDAFESWYKSITSASGALKLLKENQANINEVMEKADKAAGKQITDLKILYQTATDVNLSMNDRLAAVKALQQEFPDYFKNVRAETILNGQATEQYNALAASILATARATAAKGKLDELEAERLDIEFQKQKIRIATANQKASVLKKGVSQGIATDEFGNAVAVNTPAEQAKAIQQNADNALAVQDQRDKSLAAQEDFLIKFAGLANIAKSIEDADNKKFKDKKQKQTKEIVNIYEQELQKLKADIAKLDEKGFTDEATITKAIEEDFKKRSLAFEKAFKNKQLTAGQLSSLQTYLKDLQDLTLNFQLKGFREQRAAYLQAINDEIISVQGEENLKRIAAIQDSFERERQTIISETDKTITAIEQKRDKRISDITKNAAKNGLTPAEIAPLVNQIKNTYSKLLDDIEVLKNQRLQQLSFDTFEKLSEDSKRLLDSGNLGVSQGSLINIRAQTELFLKGKISYEKYQEELTKIAQFEANERFRLEKLFLDAEIKIRQDKLLNDKSLTDEQTAKLEDEIRRLQQQLADATKGNLSVNAADKKKLDAERLKTLLEYASAIGAVVDSVIQFWQAANEAESKALDRSIALQEKRVTAAQRIADRGNAEYLKAEEDRLTELNVKRENAARRQLGIDAALQASQILVGITGAISKIATPGIGAAETIAEIAIIIGALATGYGLVKSLQGNQPKLFKGTKYLEGPGGIDTIPAHLTKGEAVIPTDKNRAYHPTVAAIYDGTVPPELLNNFVKQYHHIKSVPQPNYERIKAAAELHIGQDGRMSILLEENNELQRQTLRAMKLMGVNVSLDQHGFAVTQMEVIEQMKRNKRV